MAWQLSGGSAHVTDLSNASVTGLVHTDGSGWASEVLAALRIPEAALSAIVDSTGGMAEATALPGAPLIAGMAGDQQASLIGQGCVRPGLAKATFGTGGMLDVCLGLQRPPFEIRGPAGTFPVVAWRDAGAISWGAEAVMLTAGSAVAWLRDGLGLIATADESSEVAGGCDDSAGVFFVRPGRPGCAGMGLRSPRHAGRADPGVGAGRGGAGGAGGCGAPGADLVEAAEADTGLILPSLRVDGGMSTNPTFVQALAAAAQPPMEVRRCRRPPSWAPPSSPVSPWGRGPAGTTSPLPGHPPRSSIPGAGSIEADGGRRATAPGAGSPTCRLSLSDVGLARSLGGGASG